MARPLPPRARPARGGRLRAGPLLLGPLLLGTTLLGGGAGVLPGLRGLGADVLVTTDGRTLEGKVVEQDDTKVVIETTFQGRHEVPRAQVKSLDTRTLPLREQLAFRREQAGNDVAKLWSLHDWCRGAGFKDELKPLLEQIVRQKPDDAKARKALGHVKVDGRWMSPEEKQVLEEAQHAAAMRAKGLVPHEGRWVTPQEKEALEKGLVKDGEEWITPEEQHRRRGERLVDGAWVRVGEAEAKAYAADASNGARVTLVPRWGPRFDVLAEVDGPVAEQASLALEKAFGALRRALSPAPEDLPDDVANRVRVVLFKKAPAYAKFAEWYAARNEIEQRAPGWGRSVQRQPAFWWVDPEPTVALYQFPNTEKMLLSGAVHGAGLVLLTQYRMNYRFPTPWLREGFAYFLEMESLGYSLTFTLGRGGGTNQGGSDTAPPWADSARWKEALKAAVAGGQDPPLKRMSGMQPEQMGYPELVKAWSVVDYLVKRKAGGFKAFVDAAKADRDAPEEDALTKAVGLNFRQLDEAWRTWVGQGFPAP